MTVGVEGAVETCGVQRAAKQHPRQPRTGRLCRFVDVLHRAASIEGRPCVVLSAPGGRGGAHQHLGQRHAGALCGVRHAVPQLEGALEVVERVCVRDDLGRVRGGGQ
jgi:hypothetical protein